MKKWVQLGFMGLALSIFGACGESSDQASGSGGSLGIPLLKPIVEEAAPSALQQQALSVFGEIESLDCDANCWTRRELAGVMLDLLDNNLEMFDQRLAEINTRGADNNPQCLTEAAVEWPVSNLPDGESRTFHFQCREAHGEFITVYFGIHEGSAYLLERVHGTYGGGEVAHDDETAGDQILMAVANMDGSEVEIWTARSKGWSENFDGTHERYNRSWIYIQANREENTFEASLSGQPWPGDGLTCGATIRGNESNFNLAMTLGRRGGDWGDHEVFCNPTTSNPAEWENLGVAFDSSGCYSAADFSETGGECTELSDLSGIPDLRARLDGDFTDLEQMGGGCGGATAVLNSVSVSGADGCYARAHLLIENPSLPTLTDFND